MSFAKSLQRSSLQAKLSGRALIQKLATLCASALFTFVVLAATQQPGQTSVAVVVADKGAIFGDFDGDGLRDQALISTNAGLSVELYFGIEARHANSPDQVWALDELSEWESTDNSRVSVADFDGDGKDELFVQSTSGEAAILSMTNDNSSMELRQRLATSELDVDWASDDRVVVSGDWTGERTDDLLIQPRDASVDVYIALTDPSGVLNQSSSWPASALDLHWDSATTLIVAGAFSSAPNHVGLISESIALMHRTSDERVSIAIVGFDAKLQPTVISKLDNVKLNTDGHFLHVADLNNDGTDDLVVTTKDGEIARVFETSSSGQLSDTTRKRLAAFPDGAKLVDGELQPVIEQKPAGVPNGVPSNVPVGATTVGTLDGGFNAINGAATYTVPVLVPPGRKGLAPNIALNYSSRNKNGLMGVGWSIEGFSQISRCRRITAIDNLSSPIQWNTSDRLCMDSERLMLVSGSYGESGSVYRTQLDQYHRITLMGGASTSAGSYFKVEMRGGNMHFYGNTGSSLVQGQNRPEPLLWLINRVEDRHGNYMSYDYLETISTGEYYPSSVTYTLPDALTARRVEFVYDSDRDDPSYSYLAGVQRAITKRLKEINTFVGANISRRYTPHYETSMVTNRSMVKHIQECAFTGGSAAAPQGQQCLKATEFTYNNEDVNPWTVNGNYGGIATGPVKYNANTTPVDFDGDGFMDLVRFEADEVIVWRGKSFAFYDQQTFPLTGFGLNAAARVTDRPQLDWNEDGRTDFTVPLGTVTGSQPIPPTGLVALGADDPDLDGQYTINWNFNSSEFTDPVTFTLEVLRGGGVPNEISLINDTFKNESHLDEDANYRYRVKACRQDEPETCSAYTSTIFVSVLSCFPSCSSPQGADKLSEAIFPEAISGAVDVKSGSETQTIGVIWFDQNNLPQVIDTNISIDGDGSGNYVVADINGDGRQDLVTRTNNQWRIHLRRPDATTLSFQTLPAAIDASTDVDVQVMNFNGDGRDDLFMTRTRESVPGPLINDLHRVLISEGTSFTPKLSHRIVEPIAHPFDVVRPLIADINGDGLSDFFGSKGPLLFGLTLNKGEGIVDPATGLPVSDTTHLYDINFYDLVIGVAGQNLVPFIKMMDFDGDGDQDLIVPRTPGAGTPVDPVSVEPTDAYNWEVWPFEGDKFSDQPIATIHNMILGSWNIFDLEGNGTLDIMATLHSEDPVNPTSHPQIILQHEGSLDMLTLVKNGLGARSRITYAPMTNSQVYEKTSDLTSDPSTFPGSKFTSAMSLVSQVDQSTGLSVNTSEDNVVLKYKYANARLDLEGRGFLGFESVAIDNVTRGVTNEYRYLLSYPFTGRPELTLTYDSNESSPSVNYISKSDLTWEKRVVHSLSGNQFECNWNNAPIPNYSCSTISGTTIAATELVYRSGATTVNKEPNNSYATIATTTQTSTVDDYGSVTFDETVVDDAVFGRSEIATTYTVNNDEATWWLDRVDEMQVHNKRVQYKAPLPPSVNGWTSTGEGKQHTNQQITKYYYNDGGSNPGPTCISNNRELCQVVVEPDSDLFGVKTDIGYGAFGNLTTYASSSGDQVSGYLDFMPRSSQVMYESGGYFANKKINAEGHEFTFSTDPATGQVTNETDPNGYSVDTTFDVFGRWHTATAEGTPTVTRVFQACSSGGANCPSHGVYKTKITQPGRASTEQFFDMYNRVKRDRYQNFDGAWVNTDTTYDTLGRATSTSNPYIGALGAKTTYGGYDLLDRPASVTLPNGETQTLVYDGFTTTTTRNAGAATSPHAMSWSAIKSSVTVDGSGQLQEAKDSSIANLSTQQANFYRFNSLGNLSYTLDAEGESSSTYFDKYGNITESRDPNRGSRAYHYDPLGQLRVVVKRDPDTHLDREYERFSYDNLGRLLTRRHQVPGNGNLLVGAWTYDVNPSLQEQAPYIGRLSRIQDYRFNGVNIESYTYDSLSRPKTMTKTITVNGATETFVTSQNYDPVQGRLSRLTYPSNLAVDYNYNGFGYLEHVDQVGGDELTRINSVNQWGQVNNQTFAAGGNLDRTSNYSSSTGLLQNTTVNCTGCADAVQDLDYGHDGFNNVVSRKKIVQIDNSNVEIEEVFSEFDELFRVKSSQLRVNGSQTDSVDYAYSRNGRILEKTDFASDYYYQEVRNAGPYAVSEVDLTGSGSIEYSYDDYGNMTEAAAVGAHTKHNRSVTYNFLNKPLTISTSDSNETLHYGPDESLLLQTRSRGAITASTYYLNSGLERVIETGANGQVISKDRQNVGGYLIHTSVSSTTDVDGDGVLDHQDNCQLIPNPTQYNYNAGTDSVGNACDADINDDGIVNALDLAAFASDFLGTNARSDFNGDGNVNFLDFPTLKDFYLQIPGPGLYQYEEYLYVFPDNLGSTDALVTPDGDVKEQFSYSLFGKQLQADGTDLEETPVNQQEYLENNSNGTAKSFTGHEQLSGSNLVHMGGRVYDPHLGRFLSADPLVSDISNGQNLDPYNYVENRPMSFTDPSGYEGLHQGGGFPTYFNCCRLGFFNLTVLFYLPQDTPLAGAGRAFATPNTGTRFTSAASVSRNSVHSFDSQITTAARAVRPPVVAVSGGTEKVDEPWKRVEIPNYSDDGFNSGENLARTAGEAIVNLINEVTAIGDINRSVEAFEEGRILAGVGHGAMAACEITKACKVADGVAAIGRGIVASGKGTFKAVGDWFKRKKPSSDVPNKGRDADGFVDSGRDPNRINSARVLKRQADEPGPFHNFPGSYDKQIFSQGQRTVVSENYVQYTLRGKVNGRAGTFEIGVRPSASGRNEVITHRFFRPDPAP